MEKIIKISGRDVRFKATAALPLYYATQFNSDFLIDMLNMGGNKGENTIKMYRMVWTMAYCADQTIKPMEQWFDDFENFPIYRIFGELDDMFWATVKGVTKKKRLTRVIRSLRRNCS